MSPNTGSGLTTTFVQDATSELTFSGPPPTGLSQSELDTLALKTAVGLLHSMHDYIHLNPIVTGCDELDPDGEQARKIDVVQLLDEFAEVEWAENEQGVRVDYSLRRPTATDDDYNVAGEWVYFAITDTLPRPMGIPGATSLSYYAALRPTVDGIESLVLAPLGVTIHGTMKVEARHADAAPAVPASGGGDDKMPAWQQTLWLREHVRVRCWWGTGWYIQKTMERSHGVMHERFRARWEEEVRQEVD